MVAGHDSTSSAQTMILYLLAQHPDVEEKVYREVVEVCGDGPISWDMLGKLDYCKKVVKEVLRLYAPAVSLKKSVH